MTYPPPGSDGTFPPPPDPPAQAYQPPVPPHPQQYGYDQSYGAGHFDGTAGDPYAAGPYPGSPHAAGPYPGSPYEGSPYEGSPYGGSPYSAYPHAPARPTEGLAVASLVVSCVGVLGLCAWWIGGLLGVVGAILGHVARRRIRGTGTGGAGLALAGIIVGWVVAAVAALSTAVLVAALFMDNGRY